jgi:hypothetical protein
LTKGYLQEFHNILVATGDEESETLFFSLAKIFERLQCLPNALACSKRTVGRLWEPFNGGTRMLTNPVFNKLEMIGKAKRASTRRGK